MVQFVSQINARADDVYRWHQTFGAHERLTPPWVSKELLRQEQTAEETLKFIKTKSGVEVEKTRLNSSNRSIISERIKSSQQKTYHTKNFDKIDNKTLIKETISVNLFNSILPEFIIESLIERRLEKEFHFRGRRIEADIRQHSRFSREARQNIGMIGSKTMISQFKPFFTSGNHKVFSLVKRKPYPTAREIQLNATKTTELEKLANLDTILYFALDTKVKLNDSNINKILKSKILELKTLIQSFEANNKYPDSFILFSSTCVYENTNSSITEYSALNKESKMAKYFLILEQMLDPLKKKGVRVVNARTGNILSARSGVLKNAIRQQKYAFCAQKVDEGKYLNWTSMDDAIYATNQMIFDRSLFGSVNLCSSMSLNANDLPLLLAEKLGRPFLFTLPKFIFNRFYGNINKEQILQGNAVYPQKLRQAGFEFNFENIEDALNWETGYFNKPNNNSLY